MIAAMSMAVMTVMPSVLPLPSPKPMPVFSE